MNPVDRWSLELRVSLWMREKNREEAMQEHWFVLVLSALVTILYLWVIA